MDVGVSAIVLTSGYASKLIVSHETSKKQTSVLTDLYHAMTSNVAILVAATIRFVLLKGINYHDHVTEWGVHWSFFCTLAVLLILVTLLRSSKYVLFYGFGLLVLSDLMTMHFDLQTYVFHAPRENLISANKEGLFSIAGYFATQMIGIGIGSDIYNTLIYAEPSVYVIHSKTKEGILKT